MENGSKRRSEGEIGVLDKVGEVISELNKSKHADQAICVLHSIAFLLFLLDPSLFSGAIGERCREKVLSVEAPSVDERREVSCGRLFTEELHSDHLLGFCCLMSLPIGLLVSRFQHENMCMMFSLLMDLPPRLFRFWSLIYSKVEVVTLMSMLFTPIRKGMD